MDKQGVVLLHGIFRTSFSMTEMAIYLRLKGFKVLNLGYPSRKMRIGELAEHINKQVTDFSGTVSKLHFVGHSMGGLVIRAYIKAHRPENLGKVVFLGTPNGGSEIADFLKDWKLFKFFYGPAGQQLITNNDKYINQLGEIDFPLLVISGNRCIGKFRHKFFNAPNDGTVSVESTKVRGMQKQVILPYGHTFIMTKCKVMEEVCKYFKAEN